MRRLFPRAGWLLFLVLSPAATVAQPPVGTPQTPESMQPLPPVPPPPTAAVIVVQQAPPPPPTPSGTAASLSLSGSLGIGRRLGPPGTENRIGEIGVRLDLLFGPNRVPTTWALGPFVDAAVVGASSGQVAFGLEALLRTFGPDLWLMAGAGRAYREGDNNDEPFLITTLGVGRRARYTSRCPYGCFRYEPKIGFYSSLRVGLGDFAARELIFGIEFDASIIALILAAA